MKVVTYFVFTLLSIAIQFVVMDFIQAQMKKDDVNTVGKIDLNNTSPKKSFSDFLQQYSQGAHALYYKATNQKLIDETSTITKQPIETYTDSSISNVSLETSTEVSSTLLDFLYDENTTATEDSFTTVTESLYTTTEFNFDNITDITFFNKKNSINVTPKTLPKKASDKECSCNLLYNVCDINCCCDWECTEKERKIFMCDKITFQKEQNNMCYSQFPFLMGSNIDELFCVVKNNLPDKRNIVHNRHEPSTLEKHFKWHSNRKFKGIQEFTKKFYKYGDPIWLLRNGTIYYVDLPSPMINNYCNERKPTRFLKDETIKCIVVLRDLEIFQVLSTADQTSVISVTEKSMNTSALDCSTFHCTNWTIILCEEFTCTNYNKSVHKPLCTDKVCTDLSLKITFTFHYYDNKIMNATITLYTQKVLPYMPFLEQEVNVKFVIANKSDDHIIKYSGNPGYITGLPLIVSYAQSNHTERFYNTTSKVKKYLIYPGNINGICTYSNFTQNFLSFRVNKRIKCSFVEEQIAEQRNETITCKNLQRKITHQIGLDREVVVSPLGNPYGLTDEDWINLKLVIPYDDVYGELNAQKTKLFCYNLINRYSLVFTFADVSEKPSNTELKILSAKVQVTASNVTINLDNISTVITVDTIFIDETKPSVYEYAAGPQLNIHLPRDFFFPFPSNVASSFVICDELLFLIFSAILAVK